MEINTTTKGNSMRVNLHPTATRLYDRHVNSIDESSRSRFKNYEAAYSHVKKIMEDYQNDNEISPRYGYTYVERNLPTDSGVVDRYGNTMTLDDIYQLIEESIADDIRMENHIQENF